MAEERGRAGQEGRWGLGFGVVLAALVLIAGAYVPRNPAVSVATPTAIAQGSRLETPSIVPALSAPPSPQATAPTPNGTVTTSTVAATSTVTATSTITIATPTPATGDREITYTVRPGDTLYDIADTFEVSPEAVSAANGITEPDRLEEGQRLIIPKTTR